MTKEELLAKVATVAAAAFATPVFAPDKSVVKGEVGDNDNTFSLGQITEPGKYLVHSVIGAKIETAEKREVNSIRVNCISEDGVPCAIYLGKGGGMMAPAKEARRIARDIARLRPDWRNPESYFENRSEIEAQLNRLARKLEQSQ